MSVGKDDFGALKGMIYSGRGIIVGMTPEGNSFVGYSLTGRSSSSQARMLLHDEKSNVIRTHVTDKEQLEKGSPALLLYPAIAYLPDNTIVASNGAQTKSICTAFMNGKRFSEEVLESAFSSPLFEYDKKDQRWIDISTYEPDAPNNTPRISAILRSPDEAAMHIVREFLREPDHNIHSIELKRGKGHLITTYFGENENPLKPFIGSPLEISVGSNNSEDIVNSIYSAIQGGANPEDNYAVSAAVMMLKGGRPHVAIRNRFSESSK